MKEFIYGYSNNQNVSYDYINANSIESALKKAKQKVLEYYGRNYKIVSISEV